MENKCRQLKKELIYVSCTGKGCVLRFTWGPVVPWLRNCLCKNSQFSWIDPRHCFGAEASFCRVRLYVPFHLVRTVRRCFRLSTLSFVHQLSRNIERYSNMMVYCHYALKHAWLHLLSRCVDLTQLIPSFECCTMSLYDDHDQLGSFWGLALTRKKAFILDLAGETNRKMSHQRRHMLSGKSTRHTDFLYLRISVLLRRSRPRQNVLMTRRKLQWLWFHTAEGSRLLYSSLVLT